MCPEKGVLEILEFLRKKEFPCLFLFSKGEAPKGRYTLGKKMCVNLEPSAVAFRLPSILTHASSKNPDARASNN